MNAAARPTGSKSVCDQVLISLRKIIQSIDVHSRVLVKRYGLTGPQLIVLREIAAGDMATAGDIARAVSLGQATVTGILERLEKRSLITRRRSDTDRRRVQLKATPEGRKFLDRTPPLMQEAFVDAFNCLEDWEKSMILASLQRLVALMNAGQIQAAPILATCDLESSDKECGPPSDGRSAADLTPI